MVSRVAPRGGLIETTSRVKRVVQPLDTTEMYRPSLRTLPWALALVAYACAVALAEPSAVAPEPAPPPMTRAEKKAKARIRGLKPAGVKPKTVKRTWTYAAKMISCRYTSDPDGEYVDDGDGLGTAECQIDGKKYTAAAAAVLVQAMHDADIPAPYYMGAEKKIAATAVTCIDEQTTRGADGPWSCTFTPVGRH